MVESRDRLLRPIDLAEVFTRRRSGALGVLSEESQRLLGSPVQQSPMRRGTGVGVTGTVGGRGLVRMGLGTPRSRIGRGRTVYRSPQLGRENSPVQGGSRRGRGRATGTVLPYWYPTTPLRDVTAVVRAIERRRAPLGEDVGLIESPEPQDQNQRVLNTNLPLSGAELEQDLRTPAPTSRKKPRPPSILKVSKILHDVTSQSPREPECLTPQRKLLNSLDNVEKVVMEELQKLKRTPSAKKAEREKRVRTLMSMR
ncbi:hypothetical protein SLEP1_g35168 [Rubroshorea leprosula]|uniref:Protein POLYCHOME-like n=1 Tax=Rubroshorea leprosula TaxID=152421 RepID=A0AAV5KMC8_9ROSI|nr:hypothetical protein SLEP1_g35168 [Rubroshorea leprosula]